jgi:hypothetical protein
VRKYSKNEENTSELANIPVFGDQGAAFRGKTIRSKYNTSLEKRIERLWQEAEHHGWTFSNFVSVVLEVLTVLHHRDKCFVHAKAKIPAKALLRRESAP